MRRSHHRASEGIWSIYITVGSNINPLSYHFGEMVKHILTNGLFFFFFPNVLLRVELNSELRVLVEHYETMKEDYVGHFPVTLI